MKLVSKAAAFGAAAALTTTGLVAAAGTPANAAAPGTATYSCTASGTVGALTSGQQFNVPVSVDPRTLSALAGGVTAGKAAPIAATGDLTQFLAALGSNASALSAAGTLTSSGNFPISLDGHAVPVTVTGKPMTAAELSSTKKLPFSGSITVPASAVGTHSAALPNSFSLAIKSSTLGDSGSVNCADANAAELALGNVVVKAPSAVHPTAAEKKLAHDKAKLKKAKKAYKKAHGAKKAKLHKKVVKLKSKVKKDKQAVKAGK